MWQLLGAPPVEVSVFVDVDEEVLARLLAYMGQFINGCCSTGDVRECTHDFFNRLSCESSLSRDLMTFATSCEDLYSRADLKLYPM